MLYKFTPDSFRLPSHLDASGKALTVPVGAIPTILWPDGHWCFPANYYMLHLERRRLSRRSRGGTLGTYAANITHLIRFSHERKIKLWDISDAQFCVFIHSLVEQRHADGTGRAARNSNTVIAIGRVCLDFLCTVGELWGKLDYVGPTGQIHGVLKNYYVDGVSGRLGGARGKVARYWDHPAFPTPDPKVRRLPVSEKHVEQMLESIRKASSSIYLRRRRYVLFKLLEITGGRRSEVARLSVESVYAASKMASPALKIFTAKRRGGVEDFRLIPISRHDVAYLIEFIEKSRSRVFSKARPSGGGDGRLLISETTGLGLRDNTVTQEIALIAKVAGVPVRVTPHMFRHRFITKLFVALIEQHNIDNEDAFRKFLLDASVIKTEIQQWTGHKTASSLEPYIHLAFEEVARFSVTRDMVRAQSTTQSVKSVLQEIRRDLKDGVSPSEATGRLLRLVDEYIKDLSEVNKRDL